MNAMETYVQEFPITVSARIALGVGVPLSFKDLDQAVQDAAEHWRTVNARQPESVWNVVPSDRFTIEVEDGTVWIIVEFDRVEVLK